MENRNWQLPLFHRKEGGTNKGELWARVFPSVELGLKHVPCLYHRWWRRTNERVTRFDAALPCAPAASWTQVTPVSERKRDRRPWLSDRPCTSPRWITEYWEDRACSSNDRENPHKESDSRVWRLFSPLGASFQYRDYGQCYHFIKSRAQREKLWPSSAVDLTCVFYLLTS